jgi:hypothetical protein
MLDLMMYGVLLGILIGALGLEADILLSSK